MPFRRFTASAAVVAFTWGATALAQPAIPEAMSFKSADGVKLHGQFYKSAKGVAAPVVLMLHDYRANPDEATWADTAKLLQEKDFNVFRFDFRGHGKSTDIIPDEFWTNPVNRAYVKIGSGLTPALKNTIKVDEFNHDKYFPMLVQDIAAARNQIDQLNDTGQLNSSTIYMLGAGNTAGLGMLFIASEWMRENKKPNVGVAPTFVGPTRQLFPTADPAGPDIGGAIWLGPTIHKSIQLADLKNWVINPRSFKMRNETNMLFVHGELDSGAKRASETLFNDVLLVTRKTGPRGEKLIKPDQTFQREIKGSKLTGVKLLGNKLDTEKYIADFLTAVEKERKNRTRRERGWDKPLIIDVRAFGVCQ